LVTLKVESENLKMKNASLTAENNLLKQQISFLEKMIMKGGNNSNEMRPEENSASILPITKNDQSNSDHTNFFRPASGQNFKKHVAIFGIMTILICSFGLMTTSVDTATQTPGLMEFKAKVGFALKGVDEPEQMESIMTKLVEKANEYDGFKTGMRYLMWTCYTIYLIYVLMIANWGYLFKNKKKLA
jgi:hypothetical protein